MELQCITTNLAIKLEKAGDLPENYIQLCPNKEHDLPYLLVIKSEVIGAFWEKDTAQKASNSFITDNGGVL